MALVMLLGVITLVARGQVNGETHWGTYPNWGTVRPPSQPFNPARQFTRTPAPFYPYPSYYTTTPSNNWFGNSNPQHTTTGSPFYPSQPFYSPTPSNNLVPDTFYYTTPDPNQPPFINPSNFLTTTSRPFGGVGPIAGGVSDQKITPEVLKTLSRALDLWDGQRGSQGLQRNPQANRIVALESYQAQVVAGRKHIFSFLMMENSRVQRCNMTIYERSWEDYFQFGRNGDPKCHAAK